MLTRGGWNDRRHTPEHYGRLLLHRGAYRFYSDTHKVLYKARRRRHTHLYGEAAQRRTGLCEDCHNGLHTLELELFAPCPAPARYLTCCKMTIDSIIKLQRENEDRSGEDDDCWLRHIEIAKTSGRQKHYQIYLDMNNRVIVADALYCTIEAIEGFPNHYGQ